MSRSSINVTGADDPRLATTDCLSPRAAFASANPYRSTMCKTCGSKRTLEKP